jgi:outer membrane protein
MMQRAVVSSLSLLAILFLLPAAVTQNALAAETPLSQEVQVEPQEDAVVLSLQDCVTAALENNLDIAVRSYDPRRSEALVIGAESRFDPLITGYASSREEDVERISSIFGPYASFVKSHIYSSTFEDPLILGGSYSFTMSAVDNVAETSGLLSQGFESEWTLNFKQPLLRNFGPGVNRTTIVVARNTLAISEAQFRQTVLDTVSDVEKSYWNLNFALMELNTTRGSLQLAKDFLEQNRIKVRVGTMAPIEITQAEAGVADREEGVIVAEHAVRTAEDAMRRVMGVPKDSPMWFQPIRPSERPPLDEVSIDMEEVVASARANRPDLEQARLDLASKEEDLDAARNQRRWGLDFEGSYGSQGFNEDRYRDAFEEMRDRISSPSWTLALTLSVPIGNRLAIANYTDAEYARNQARSEFERVEQAARVEVRNAVRRIETDLKRVRAAQVNVRLQREKLDAEQKKFENGMSTSFQVLQFQTDLSEAETRENLAIVDYNKSLVELERVKGTLLEARGIETPRPEGEAGDTHDAIGLDVRPSETLRAMWKGNRDVYGDLSLQVRDVAPERTVLPSDFTFRRDPSPRGGDDVAPSDAAPAGVADRR